MSKPFIFILCMFFLSSGSVASAQPRYVRVSMGEVSIVAELADTPQLREKGLMFRKSLAADTGMLFVFDKERPVSFWMKNTLIDLDIAYISAQGVIMRILTMKRLSETGHPSGFPVKWALEVPAGYFAKKGIQCGEKVVYTAPNGAF